jgi:hypothetical protein
MTLSAGDQVAWNSGGGKAEGVIIARFTRKVTRTLKDAEVTRNASPDTPAFLIRQADGTEVLKSATEIDAV